MDRDFAINLLARSSAVMGLVQHFVFILRENTARGAPKTWLRVAGDLTMAISDLLQGPTFREHPDLECRFRQIETSAGRAPIATWGRSDGDAVLTAPKPADATTLTRDEALRMLQVAQTCVWLLGFLLNDGNRDRVTELEHVRHAVKVWCGLLIASVVVPLRTTYPDLPGEPPEAWAPYWTQSE